MHKVLQRRRSFFGDVQPAQLSWVAAPQEKCDVPALKATVWGKSLTSPGYLGNKKKQNIGSYTSRTGAFCNEDWPISWDHSRSLKYCNGNGWEWVAESGAKVGHLWPLRFDVCSAFANQNSLTGTIKQSVATSCQLWWNPRAWQYWCKRLWTMTMIINFC